MDELDLAILACLQSNGRMSNAEMGRRVGLVPSAVYQRVRKLEEQGVIRGYRVELDPVALDQGLLAFVTVRTSEGARAPETSAALAGIPEVLEVHRVVGEDCFFLKVRVADTAALGRLLDETIQPLKQVASTRTTIVLCTAKDAPGARVHVPAPAPSLDNETLSESA
ncbi:MAG: Lrp/AsnC family transcriptional regulator [Gemmatimonadota bacterium]